MVSTFDHASSDARSAVGRASWIVIASFAIAATLLALRSDGAYQDDDLTHFLFARWATRDPRYLLDFWGRPGFTVPYALVAGLGSPETGFMLSRLLTVLIAAASAWLTARVAARLGLRFVWLAPAALWTMPLYFRMSFTTLTETICGLYLITSTHLLAGGRHRTAAAVLALAPIARTETIVLLGPIALYLLLRRKWIATLLLGWAILLWNVLSWRFLGRVPFSALYLSPTRTEQYGYGGPLHYVQMWAEASGPALVVLALLGVGLLALRHGAWFGLPALRAPVGESADASADRGRRLDLACVRALIVGGTVGFVVLHTWLYMNSPFAGGGYARFLVPAAPWMAVAAAVGFEPFLALALGTADASAKRRVRLGSVALVASSWLLYQSIMHDGQWFYTPVQTRWWGEPLALLRAYLPWLAWAAVLAAIVPGRLPASLLSIVASIYIGSVCATSFRPHRLTNEQLTLRQAVRYARDTLGLHGAMASHSPWVPWFDGQTFPWTHPMGGYLWDQSPPGTILVFESRLALWPLVVARRARDANVDVSTSGRRLDLAVAEVRRQPCKLVYALDLQSVFYPDPYVQVYVKTGRLPR